MAGELSDVYQDVVAMVSYLSEEEKLQLLAELPSVCPYDCDGCHGEECPCERMGCAGEKGD